jgi:50S ribosomal protein L16 3-hydroxylase
MSRPPDFDRLLLGGLSPATFLQRHWQQKPLLIRGAVDELAALPKRDDVFELAARDDVESRLISSVDGRWSLEQGPFVRMPKSKRDWTVLVQGVNLFDRAADALMRRFDFVSTMRLDDLMISYAVDGGGVGPHLDSYDVFLLQVEGRRRWRWRNQRSTTARGRALVENMPVKLLKHFVPTDEAILEPGDMLYLPPSCAHEGVAIGNCITASIGFRAPSWNELTQEFLFAMAERNWPDGRHGDAGRSMTKTPGAMDAAMIGAITEQLARIRFTASDVETFVGTYFSEPKQHVFFEAPDRMTMAAFAKRAARHGVALDLAATMLYRGKRAFIAGETCDLPSKTASIFRHLADRRRLDAADVRALIDDDAARALLYEWWQHGWVVLDDGGVDGTS